MWFVSIALLWQPPPDETLKTLEHAGRLEQVESRKLLGDAISRFRAAKDMPAQQREEVLAALARLIPKKAQTTKEVLEIVGPQSSKSVSRQVFFRRYLEQWAFDNPLRLLLVFDCTLGHEPRLLEVTVLP